jgi:uncharacterized membrane protein
MKNQAIIIIKIKKTTKTKVIVKVRKISNQYRIYKNSLSRNNSQKTKIITNKFQIFHYSSKD